MKILIISPDYPFEESNNYIFVKQLVDKWFNNNHEIDVIASQSLTNVLLKNSVKRPFVHKIGINYYLYSPKYISFSRIPLLRKLNLVFSSHAIKKTSKKLRKKYDFIYAHFIVSGYYANKLSKIFDAPYFIATGESSFNQYKGSKFGLFKSALINSRGIIAVSTEIEKRIHSHFNLSVNHKILVAPNGYNPEKFYKKTSNSKIDLGYSENDFIIAFVGGFIERKGILRLDSALKEINIKNIKSIYIGNGPLAPSYKNQIHKGPISHDKIIDYLNAADIFVLPTNNEGSCNAIIEAMACGLPIVSSNQAFNDDILNDSYSIRINPMSIGDIKKAILTLYEDEDLRKFMSKNALKRVSNFDLKTRARSIFAFIKRKLKE